MAALFPVLSPERSQAEALNTAVFGLLHYYGPSQGKRARALYDKMHAVFWEPAFDNHNSIVLYLAHVDTPAQRERRARIWHDKLRPVLADKAFLDELTGTLVRVRKDVFVTLAQRDAHIETLRASVAYWDNHFAL